MWLLGIFFLFLFLISTQGRLRPRHARRPPFSNNHLMSFCSLRLQPEDSNLRTCTVLNGRKSKRKNKNTGGSTDEEDTSEEEAPSKPRVDPNLGNVKYQIALVRHMKQQEKESKKQFEKTRFTAKKKDDYQNNVFVEDYTPFDPKTTKSILLVDGYNVICKWSKTIKARSQGAVAYARDVLLEELNYLSVTRGDNIFIVYDGNRPGPEAKIEKGALIEIFTGEGESADSYIQRKSREFVKKGCPNVMIASDDSSVRSISLGNGAQVHSVSRLIQDIYVARKMLTLRATGDYHKQEGMWDDNEEYFKYSRD